MSRHWHSSMGIVSWVAASATTTFTCSRRPFWPRRQRLRERAAQRVLGQLNVARRWRMGDLRRRR
jgi:hypothetical protein